MSHHLVEVQNLRYTYPDGTPALADLSFRITHGESVAIVGANGAGKSTLLLHLNGLLSPREGTVRVGDIPLTRQTLPDVRKAVGMVFQNPDDQLFMPSVVDDVAFGPLNLGLPPEEVTHRVDRALERVGASALRDRPPYRLSSGEKHCVAIATVLAMSPDILVMDEPSANLDPATRRRLIELLGGFEHTKIIATHDLELVLELCDRTIILRDGTVAGDGPTREIFRDDELLDSCKLERPAGQRPCPECGAEPS